MNFKATAVDTLISVNLSLLYKIIGILVFSIFVSTAGAVAAEVSPLYLSIYDTADPIEVGTETIYVFDLRNEGVLPITGLQISYEPSEELLVNGWSAGMEEPFQPAPIETVSELAPGDSYEIRVKAKALRAASPAKLRVIVRQGTDGEPTFEEEPTYIYQ